MQRANLRTFPALQHAGERVAWCLAWQRQRAPVSAPGIAGTAGSHQEEGGMQQLVQSGAMACIEALLECAGAVHDKVRGGTVLRCHIQIIYEHSKRGLAS